MTTALLANPVSQDSLLDGGCTLEDLLTSALADVRANGSTECPVCHARMTRTSSTRARERTGAREAECSGCGSRLS
jgi:hypothetical protein